jgi:hypothetical protein
VNAWLVVGLSATAALVLLVALLAREPAPSSSAATPAASAAERQVRPAPAVEQPDEALVVESQVEPDDDADAASAEASDMTPRNDEPLEHDARERLPEGWTPPPKQLGSVTVFVTSGFDGHAFEGALVWTESFGEVGRYEMPEPIHSDAYGNVVFENVPAGPVHICTRPPGSKVLVHVTHGQNSAAKVTIGPQLRAIDGSVLTADGDPAEGAEIWNAVLDYTGDVPYPLARTDRSGQFRIWLTDNSVRFMCARRGAELPSHIVGIPQNATGSEERVEFVLGSVGETLQVHVRGLNGKAIENAGVWVSCSASPDLAQWRDFSSSRGGAGNFWRSKTDALGFATFEGLPRGVVSVTAAADGYVSESVQVRLPHPDDPPELSALDKTSIFVANRRLELVLGRGGVLEGRVLLQDGLPAVSAAVRYGSQHRPGSATTHTDSNGYFRLHAVPTRFCHVWARLGDYASQTGLPAVPDGVTRWWAPVLTYSPR